jgi:phosphoenolpyruvate synthase/pyruvate phosphate dikinase
MANDAERALRERAKRLGYRIRRRGIDYRLIDDAEAEAIGFQDINGINLWLDVIEHKLPLQVSTACDITLWTSGNGQGRDDR